MNKILGLLLLFVALSFSHKSYGQLAITVSPTDVTCFEGNDGEIKVVVTEGNAPYRYILVIEEAGGDIPLANHINQSMSSLTFKTGNGSLNEHLAESRGIAQNISYKIRVLSSDPDEIRTKTVSIGEPDELNFRSGLTTTEDCDNSGSGSITIQANGGTAPYTVSYGSGITNFESVELKAEGDNFTFEDIAAGTYEVRIEDKNTCTRKENNVTVAAGSNAGTSGTHTFCSNDSPSNLYADLGGSPDAGGTWTGPSNLSGDYLGTFDPATISEGNYTYTYTVNGRHPCADVAQIVTVIINTVPVADAPENITACGSYLLPVLSVGNYFTESEGGGNQLFENNSITETQTIFVYAETGTTPNCTAENSFLVTINKTPNAGTATPQTTCSNNNNFDLFTGLAGSDAGGTWSDDDVTGALDGNIFDATAMPAATTYNFTYTVVVADCANDTETIEVTVTTAPNAGTATPQTTCSNNNNFDLFTGLTDSDAGGTWSDDEATGNLVNRIFDATLATETVYNFTYTVSARGCTDVSSVILTINTASVAPTGATVDVPIYCENDAPENISLTADGGTLGTDATVEWSSDETFATSAGSGSPLEITAPTATTTYYVRYDKGCNGSTTDQSVTVTINTAPEADAPGDVTACGSYLLPVLGVGNYFTETEGGGDPLSADEDITETQTIFVYAETETEPSCTAENSFLVTINKTPNAGLALAYSPLNLVICDGETITVTIHSAEVGIEYELIDETNASVSEVVTGAGVNLDLTSQVLNTTQTSLTLRARTAHCTVDFTSVNIVLNAIPLTPTIISTNSTVCDKDDPDVTLTSSLAPHTGTYVWYKEELPTGDVNQAINLSGALSSGDYTVVVIDGVSGCKSASSLAETVTVSPLPDITITGSNAVCENKTADYSVPDAGVDAIYNWTVNGTESFSGESTKDLSVNWLEENGNVRVDVVGGNTCTNSSAEFAVAVSAESSPPNGSTNIAESYCQDSSLPELDANASVGADEINWYSDVALTTKIGNSNPFTPSATDLDMSTAGTTTFYVTQDLGCNQSAAIEYAVNVVGLPDATITGSNVVCKNTTAIYSVPDAGVDAIYKWTVIGAGSFSDETTKDLSVNWQEENGAVQVDVVGGNTCTNSSAEYTVAVSGVSSPPVDNNATNPVVVCQNGTPPIISVVGIDVIWYKETGQVTILGNGSSFDTGNPINANDALDMSVFGTKSYFATQDEGCGESGTVEIKVTIENCSGCYTVTPSKVDATCTDDNGSITLVVGVNGVSPYYYELTNTATGNKTTQDQPNNTFTVTQLASGTYTYLLRDKTACEVTGSIDVGKKATTIIADINKTGDMACFGAPTGGSATITVQEGGTDPYFYSVDDGLSWIQFTSGEDVNGLPSGQNYAIWVGDTNIEQCPHIEIISISEPSAISGIIENVVHTFPEQDVGAFDVVDIKSDFPPCEILLEDENGSVIIDFTHVKKDRFGRYEYQFQQLPMGTYMAVIKDASDCERVLPQIIIDSRTEVTIPNVFTPNNDGINEAFIVLNKKANTKIIVTNRWGIEVFKSDDYQNDWRGEGVPDAVYFYTISMDNQVYKGIVEIWRGRTKIN